MKVVVLISAIAEWEAVKEVLHPSALRATPYGETFEHTFDGQPVNLLHAGWGKVASAGAMQYALDHYQPDLVVNLGTCGGFEGCIERGEVILVERTFFYDIVELMGDFGAVADYYASTLDLGWLPEPYPHPVRRGILASADSDLLPKKIPHLKAQGALAADWESGALAWVARKNGARLLILRAVSDLVGEGGGEAYDNIALFKERARTIMRQLLGQLPDWLAAVRPLIPV
ncbi:MAG: hypothetical protein ACOYYJ_04035 [Chloroflexota bacterium]